MGTGIQGFEFLGPSNKDTTLATDGTVDTSTSATQSTAAQSTSVQDLSLTFDSTAKDALDKSLTSGELSKAAAIADSKQAADYAMKEVLKSGMPGISGAAKSAGGYNNTTKEMLTNDLSAKASATQSAVLLDTITKYANANASNINAATGAVNATTGKKSTAANTSTSDSSSTSDSLAITDTTSVNQERSAGALWDSMNPGDVAGGRYSGSGSQTGSSPFGTVICTQMYLDGFLTREEYIADNRYVRNNFKQATARGYRYWAVPFVQFMRRNSVAYAVGKFFGVRWSKHCAAYYLDSCEHNVTGWIMSTFVAPICFVIGTVVTDTEFDTLWEANRG